MHPVVCLRLLPVVCLVLLLPLAAAAQSSTGWPRTVSDDTGAS